MIIRLSLFILGCISGCKSCNNLIINLICGAGGELIDEATGEAYQISSPGWAGAYPWINKQGRVYGFFIAHVQGSSQKEDGFSSFYGSPVISQTVSNIISLKR